MSQELTQTSTAVVAATIDLNDEGLLREYHWLIDGTMLGLLTSEQQDRMQEVQTILDDRDLKSPAAAAMRQNMRGMQQSLDVLEAQIQKLPNT